jgi:SAM-dependent methyltransferase
MFLNVPEAKKSMFSSFDAEAVRRMYASEDAWRTRQDIHDRYSVPPTDIIGWALGCIRWRGDEVILDVGCGPGRWYTPLKERFPGMTYFGLDLFPAMLRNHPVLQRINRADAQHLPFPDHHFDVVMANHMMFDVPDPQKAILEFRRVLKPSGLVMATTNSVHNMPEIQALVRRAVMLLAPPGMSNPRVPAQHTDQFTLESGTRMLSRHFYAVVRHDLPGTLVVPDAEPIIAYVESTRSVREVELPPGVKWDDVMLIMRDQINRLIEHFGELQVNKLAGVLVATDQGDFIHEYLQYRASAKPSVESEAAPVSLSVYTPGKVMPRRRKSKKRKKRSHL